MSEQQTTQSVDQTFQFRSDLYRYEAGDGELVIYIAKTDQELLRTMIPQDQTVGKPFIYAVMDCYWFGFQQGIVIGREDAQREVRRALGITP